MSYTFPAGTYVIGDPCYNLSHERFDEFLSSSDSLETAGQVTLSDGSTVAVAAFFTARGDGRYNDHSGFEYAVDSASIGIMPLSALEGAEPDESTKVVKFKHEFECYDSAGTLVFGHIEINTNSSSDEEDEEDDDVGALGGEFDFGDLDSDY